MRMIPFAVRNAKEIVRDPINLGFGLGFPLVLLVLLHTMQRNIPINLFEIGRLAPGIAVFGLSFMSLFAATLIAKDRESAFLQRLYTSPMRGGDFIWGYMLPLLPIALAQVVVVYAVAVALGLGLSLNLLYAVLGMIPVAVFFIALGLLCGSLLGVKQVSGLCGALLTNLSAWLSGVWFELSLMGSVFERVARLLPFVHAVELERALLVGELGEALVHLVPILLYGIATTAIAILCFLHKKKEQA